MRNRPLVPYLLSLAIAPVVLSATACSSGENRVAERDTAMVATSDTATPRSLYDRLGGKPAITSVIDTFVARVAADERINKKFARSNIPRVKTLLVDQICTQTGGPCTYSGRSMAETHRRMGVTEGEFNTLVEDLVATLDSFNVPQKEKDELLAALGTMKSDIVEVQSQATGTALPAAFKAAPPLSANP